MDDIQDQMMVADEIGNAISQPLQSDTFDESELEAELDILNNQNEQKLNEQFPSIPNKAKITQNQDSDPFKNLELEMDENV